MSYIVNIRHGLKLIACRSSIPVRTGIGDPQAFMGYVKQAAMAAGHKSDACLSNVDVMPTLLGLVGGEVPTDVEGMDFCHCARKEDGPEPEFAFLQDTGACAIWEDGHEWRAVRTKQHSYAIYKVDGKELLFNNAADP
jgi:arylsulfatase A-like enzyme